MLHSNIISTSPLFKPKPIAFLLSAWAIPVVYAAEEPKMAELPPVVVTATPFANQSELNMTQPVSVVKGDDLRHKRESSLGDTLSQELGVTSTSFGPAAGRPVIRGMDGPRIRVLENGIGTMDVSTVSPDHMVTTESFNASQIEILRGPATLLYGSSASGGVVNVVSDRIPERFFKAPQGNVEFRANSATDERAGAFNINAGDQHVSVHLDGFKRRTGDYDIPGKANPSDPNSADGVVRNSAMDAHGISLGGSFIGERGFIGASVSHLENYYGIPGPEGAKIDLDQTRYDLAGELSDPFAGFEALKVKIGNNQYQHSEIEASGDVGTVFHNKGWETRVELRHKPLAGWRGAFGLQHQDRDFSAVGEETIVPATQSHATGLFMVETRDGDRWRLDVGGRVERAEQNPRNGVNPSRRFNLYSASTGGLWKFMDGYSVGVSATGAQRAPSTEELYSNGAHAGTASFEVGNNALSKETSRNIDLSFRKTDGAVKWTLNVFRNRIKNYIYGQSADTNSDGIADRVDESGTLDPNGEFLVQNIAQMGAKFSGAEAEASFALIPDKLDLRVFSDYVRAKLDDGSNVPRIAPMRAGFELTHRVGAWESSLKTTWVSKQTKTASFETTTPGYTLLNLGVDYHIKDSSAMRYTVFLQGKNLLDEDVRVHTSYLKNVAPLPGRALVVGVRGEFY